MTTDLAARIEAAQEGCRELDAEVYNACPEPGRVAVRLPMSQWEGRFVDGWRTKKRDGEDKYPEKLKRYSTNIHDALTMLLEGSEYEISTLYGVARVGVDLNTDSPCYGEHKGGDVALAMCAAGLRAREASHD